MCVSVSTSVTVRLVFRDPSLLGKMSHFSILSVPTLSVIILCRVFERVFLCPVLRYFGLKSRKKLFFCGYINIYKDVIHPHQDIHRYRVLDPIELEFRLNPLPYSPNISDLNKLDQKRVIVCDQYYIKSHYSI